MTFHHTFVELLSPLFRDEAHTKLGFQPTGLSLIDVSMVMFLFMIRSVLQSIGLQRSARPSDAASKPPATSLSMPLHLTAEHLASYAKAVDPAQAHEVDLNNAQLLLCLSSITEPAMLLLLAKSTCPIRPLGAVNVRNRFELLRPAGEKRPTTDLLLGSAAIVTASLHSAPRVARRGLEYDIETTLSLPDPKDTQQQVSVFRQTFTMLQFMDTKKHAISPVASSAVEGGIASSGGEGLPVTIGLNEPSNWAAISKDYNPIHTSSLAARGFGFPGKIAHGNHVVAKALHALSVKSGHDDTTGAPVLGNSNTSIQMEVSFKKPVTVPNQVQFRVAQKEADETTTRFEMWQGKKMCINGYIGALHH